MRSWALAFALLGTACEAETRPLRPTTVRGECASFHFDVDSSGELELVEDVRCAGGTLCGDGLGYRLCPTEGGSTRELPGGSLAFGPASVAAARARHPSYPACSTDAECAPGLCLLQPGCEAPEGVCCASDVCRAEGLRAEVDCREAGCLTLCGCDGRTFEGLPTRPFAHAGACAD